ncbi:hypothetical protein RchiOBHm_Chr2g0138981 [Rosa chinensis]|uniref:Helitron helicase-like domain-containing protein n=2 Tax=Rosa chinensis TaxID=74649 RepID=A0A2P6RX04_ROSCH|nr:hypothetical protein RchiOBHm_Chr2g0138981 [Rosa chinensis]
MTEQNQCLHSQYSSVCQNVNISEHRNNRFRETLEHSESSSSSQFVQTDEIRDSDQYSHSFGQASYQRSRQGLIVTYQDSGDNVYTCSHCNACFWSGEALKRSTSNGPLIYTNCCRRGQIKLGQSKPTPAFLERLLDPNNGPQSRTFRENIRVYNSMFSFTSMGTAIDQKINTELGPYVFKISGQVHYLMGFILPSDGLCPQYA